MGAPPSVRDRILILVKLKWLKKSLQTPAPRRFLVPGRSAQKPVDSTPASTAPKFFSSTPRFGSTQRGLEDVEDVDSAEESENNHGDDSDGDRIADSIEVHDGLGVDDDIVPDSIEVHDHIGEVPVELEPGVSSQDEREVKRRRLSASMPAPEEDLQDSEDDQDLQPQGLERTPATQPVFRPPPRFKQVTDEAYEALPDVFSPQRKGAKYVVGGLAAELQGWLSDVKGGQEDLGDVEQARFTVEEVKPGTRMYLVRGAFGKDKRNVILAGEGKLTGIGRRAVVQEGSRIALGRLGWEIEMDGEEWYVSCDWSLL